MREAMRPNRVQLVRRACAALFSLALLAAAADAAAQPSPAKPAPRAGLASLTFGNLVVRIEGRERIGFAEQDYRVFILEKLRASGFNALGVESLVFDEDKSEEADFVLGGVMTEMHCLQRGELVHACRVGIEWQLLHARSEQVVYRVLTRFGAGGLRDLEGAVIGKRLVLGALARLTARPGFSAALRARPRAEDRTYQAASFRACAAEPRVMPDAAESVLPAVVVVENGKGFGSGFFISADGLVLTAAHVLGESPPTVKTRDGHVYETRVLRVSRKVDAALLELTSGSAPTLPSPCLALASGPAAAGSDVYAAGAPAARELAASLSRGIVSGAPTLEGSRFVQTDAAISPGHSGGPLLDAQGHALALASFKVLGGGVDGVAFGVPIDTALAALALRAADTSELATLRADAGETGAQAKAPASEPVVDTPDPVPDLEPARASKGRGSSFLEHFLRWGGLGLAANGAIVAGLTYAQFKDESTDPSTYDDLRLANDIGWVAVGIGAVAFGASFLVGSSSEEKPKSQTAASLQLSPVSAQLRVTY
jgi:S1-C subfamily serine protease